MTMEEKRLYTQYFYNSVIEFIYFIISYLGVYRVVSLGDLYQYIKFFKDEVNTLVSSFEGKSGEDKLCQLLKTLDCFVVSKSEVRIVEPGSLKDDICEELLLSRSVDLILKGLNSVSDICANLNADGVVEVKKQNLLHIFEKYSFISVDKVSVVTLHHAHGLLGFEDYLYNSVTGYFYDILYHSNILSYNEVISHSKSISFCGINNILAVFSILNSSPQFICRDGYVLLRKKCRKYPKKKALHMEEMGSSFSSRSLPVGQIVYSTFGDVIYRWTGEIGTLTASLGVIYCVVDFTNGLQGVFNIYFSKAALKSIAGIVNLKEHLNVWDMVEFDAEHYTGKSLDRCWKATRVKLLSRKKIQYDESLCAKLNENTELQRNKCNNYMCCAKNSSSNCSVNGSPMLNGKSLTEKAISDYDLSFLNLKDSPVSQKTSSAFASVTNTQVPDYLFLFGHVTLLMEDKGVVTATHGYNSCSILFLKESVYHRSKSEPFVSKGQKVLAFVPYMGKLEAFSVATLIYGLSEKEAGETDDVLPKEFVVKTFLWNELKDLCSGFCCNCRFLNGSQTVNMESFDRDIKYKIQLAELYDFIIQQYKMPLANNKLQLLLHSICREKFDCESSSNRIFHFFARLSKYLSNCTKHIKSNKKMKIFHSENDLLIQQEEPSAITFRAKTKSLDSAPKSRLSSRSRACDLTGSSFGSLNSYKTCSTGSSEVFYSCDSSRANTPLRVGTPVRCSTPNDKSKTLSTISSLETANSEYFSKSDLKTLSTTEEMRHITDGVHELSPTILYDESKSPPTISNLETAMTEYFSKIDLKRLPPTEEMYHETDADSELGLTPLPTVLNDECKILSVYCQDTKINPKQFSKSYLKASKYHNYFSLWSVPCLKVKKKKRTSFQYTLKPPCKNCTRSFVETTGIVSLISTSCFFFTTSIDGVGVVLALPRNDIPKELQEKMKVGFRADITVVPSVVLNLSHIMKIKSSYLK